MAGLDTGPRSFSGAELAGERLARFIYMDEAGISAGEPHAVVGAVVVDPDRQYAEAQRRLKKLADDTVPVGKRRGFFFHATELYSGGDTFPRENRGGPPAEERWRILERVLAIPSAVDLPVVVGHAIKKDFETRRAQAVAAHTVAFIYAVLGAERFMRRHADPDEIAMIVAEDNDQARATLKAAQMLMQDEGAARRLLPPSMHDELPLTRIVDAPHFTSKAASPLLQLADACSFLFKRHLEGQHDNERFMRSFFAGSDEPMRNGGPLSGPVNHACFVWRRA